MRMDEAAWFDLGQLLAYPFGLLELLHASTVSFLYGSRGRGLGGYMVGMVSAFTNSPSWHKRR